MHLVAQHFARRGVHRFERFLVFDKSPNWLLSSSPTGRSIETGSAADCKIRCTFVAATFQRADFFIHRLPPL